MGIHLGWLYYMAVSLAWNIGSEEKVWKVMHSTMMQRLNMNTYCFKRQCRWDFSLTLNYIKIRFFSRFKFNNLINVKKN